MLRLNASNNYQKIAQPCYTTGMSYPLLEIFGTAFTFFLLMDSIGNIPFFISILKNIPPKKQRLIIIRELLIALAIMITFSFVGETFLEALKISQPAVAMAGGVILFILSLKMTFPSQEGENFSKEAGPQPFIVPLAVPLVAGPAILASIMAYARDQNNQLITVSAICIAWAASMIVLLLSSFLQRNLGKRGIIACERLMGFILLMLSFQMFLNGLTIYLSYLPSK